MNFIEGLRRLFVIAGVLTVVASAFIAWDANRDASGCQVGKISPKTLKPWEMYQSKDFSSEEGAQHPSSSRPYADLSDNELLALYARAKNGEVVEQPKDEPWKNDHQVNSVTHELCPSEVEALLKRGGITLLSAVATALCVWLFWLLVRWVLVGFFPALRLK